jgi:DNA repair exonuclease SbcCD ATPase subunit
MAKKISVTDIFEEADIFLKIRKSAEDTIITLGKMKAELSESAKLVKEGVKNSSVTNTKGIQEFTNFTQKANQLQRESIEIQKQEAQAKKLITQATMEEVKLKKLADAEAQKQINASAKIAKALQNEASVFKQLEKNTRDYKNQSKELAATLLQMRDSGQKSTDQYAKLEQQFREVTIEAQKGDAELKRIDKTVGDNFRNVGNYEGAIKPLKVQLRELTQAMQNMEASDPKFQEMANKAGELKDQIQDTAAVIKSTAGSGLENMAGSMAKVGQVGVAAFQGVQSSMVLLGVENEDVLKSMQKLQALAGLGDALKVLGGIGDTVTEIKAGFTAALSKMGILKTATIAQTTAQAGQVAITEAQTVAQATNTAVNEAGLAVDTAQAVVDTEQAVLNAEDLALTTAQTGATVVQTGATVAQTAVTETATVAQTGLNTAMKLNPIGLLIAGLVALTAAVAGYLFFANKETKAQKEAKDAAVERAKAQKETTEGVAKESSEFVGLIYQLKQTNAGSKERKTLMKEINSTYGTTLQNISDETAFQAQLNLAVQDYIAFQKTRFKLEANKGKMNKLLQQEMEFESKLTEIIARKMNAQTSGEKAGIAQEENRVRSTILNLNNQMAQLASTDLELKNTQNDLTNNGKKYQVQTEKITNGVSNETLTNTELIAKLKELKQAREDVNVSDEQILANQLIRDKQDLQSIYDKSKKDAEAKQALIDGKLLLEQKYWDDIKKIEDDADKTQQERIDARKKQESDRLNNIADLEEKARDEYERATMTARQLEERDINDKYFYLIAQAEKYGWDVMALKKKQAEEIAALDKKDAKSSVKTEKERQEEIKKMVQQTSEFFTKQSEKKVAILDKEISASEKQLDSLKALAESGNINAQDSMAEQQRIIDEGNRQKLAEQKRQARIKLAESVYSTYSQKVEDGSKNPLADTIKDTVLLQQFISSLPAFEKGTEDTGKNGLGVDGRGGFHAVLHPNERVIPKGLNEQIGNLTNEQLAKVAQEYQNGKSINGGLQVQSSMDFALLMNEVKDLKSVIKNKPETNIELGEITGSLMEIVQTTKRGNNTTYNRFKVRK